MSFKELNEQGVGKFIYLDKYGLNTFALKVIAMATMFIDHFAVMFCEENEQIYLILRSIGRISFPIFCFVLTQGFFHTKDRLKYAIRLGVFALISEIPYNMLHGTFFSLKEQNVMFTLLFGFLTIWSMNSIAMFKVRYPDKLLKYIGAGRLNTILELAVMMIGMGSAYFMRTSYSYAGVMLIICFYALHKYPLGRLLSNMVFNMGMFGFTIQWWGTLSAIPIAFYNGKPGPKKGKYFFYWFYPIHLSVLVLARGLCLHIGIL